MILSPICFIRQWAGCLQMHVNSFRYGHTDLKWRIRGNQNFIWSKKLQGSNLTISNLEKAGVYEFWTESESETSAKVQIDIRMDTPEMIFDKILTYAEIEPSSQWQKEFVFVNEKVSHLIMNF